MAQTQCYSCKWTFTHHGLSLYITKTQKSHCNIVIATSQFGLAPSLVQIASPTSQLPNKYGSADDWIPDKDYNFAALPSDGEFAMLVYA